MLECPNRIIPRNKLDSICMRSDDRIPNINRLEVADTIAWRYDLNEEAVATRRALKKGDDEPGRYADGINGSVKPIAGRPVAQR